MSIGTEMSEEFHVKKILHTVISDGIQGKKSLQRSQSGANKIRLLKIVSFQLSFGLLIPFLALGFIFIFIAIGK